MANIFVYKNRLWKEKYVYTNPGIHPVTLSAGEYLMMCYGAKGGSVTFSGDTIDYHNLGGVAYGILNLNSEKSMYAYVGGDGGDSGNSGHAIGTGGFNGGGNGGRAYYDYANNDNYKAGAGGGGASDIRIHTTSDFAPDINYVPNLPPDYKRVEFIETSGNLYFDTGYIAKSNTTFKFAASYITNSSANVEMAFMGTQSNNNTNPGWVIWMNSAYENIPKIASIYGNMQWVDSSSYENYMTRTTIPSGKVATYQIDKWGTFVNDHPMCYNSDITGDPQSDATMILCCNRRAGSIMTDRFFVGKIYYVRAFEYENGVHVLKLELIPCVRVSDQVPGFYDTISGNFITCTYHTTPGICTPGPVTNAPMLRPSVTERYYPTIPDTYEQIEYIESTDGSVYFDSTYIANENSIVTFRDAITSSSSNEAIFGSQTNDTIDAGWNCRQYSSSGHVLLASIYGDMTWNSSYAKYTYIYHNYSAFYRVEKDRTFVNLRQLSDFVPGGEPEQNHSIYIMACRGAGTSLANNPIRGRLYHFRIYEKTEDGEVLKHEFVPCKRLSDDVIGLYDTVENNPETHEHLFLIPETGTPTAGTTGSFPIVDYDGKAVDQDIPGEVESLNTRIIVAGGGGGAAVWHNNLDRRVYAGIGGGIHGGFMETQDAPMTRPYATVDSGGSFGVGQNGRHSDRNSDAQHSGASGGGGGWFGGFAATTNIHGSNGAGGGGSGYVLTSESYIPEGYMDDYEQYQMTHPFLGAGYAINACVRICEPYDALHTGDTITVYGFNETQEIPVPPGIYTLKCWGADGGYTYDNTYASRGGYAQGVLSLETPNILYATVGGSGMYYDLGSTYQVGITGSEYVHQLRPDIGFNGGGLAYQYGASDIAANSGYDGAPGGGGTDIRIGSDSLYARVIVAGGSAGSNATAQPFKGGVGGGETGGIGTTSGAGISPGPGTQTGSPIDPSFNVNGGFGYGGNSIRVANAGNISAGAGGGGWYGGSSSYKLSTYGSNVKSGNGGSGYVFTDGSYTPPGYLLTEEFHLTDTALVQGGNSLPVGISKIEIVVNETKTVRILCKDLTSSSYKYFNTTTNEWENIIPIVTELTPEVFMQYGSLVMETDRGLLDDYEIFIYDPDDTTSKISMNVVPNPQTIQTETTTDIAIRQMKPRLDFDPDDFDINISATKQTLVSGTKIRTKIEATKKTHTDAKAKIYYITYSDGK